MPKFVETPDGIIHQLPDSVTDENYLEEKEKFLANYNIPQPQEDFTSQTQPQPEPQPEISTDLPSSALIGASLLNRVEENEGRFFGRRDYTEEDKESSGYGLQIRGGGSKIFREQPARFNQQDLLVLKFQLQDERNKILSKVSLTTEDKDRLNEIDRLIKGKDDLTDEDIQKGISTYETITDPLYKRIGTIDASYVYDKLGLGLDALIDDEQKAIDKSVEFQSGITYSKSFEDLTKASSADEAMEIFLSDPFNLAFQVLASSAAPMSVSLGAGVGTTLLTGNLVAGAIATGVASGSVDYSYSFIEYMQKQGVNINDAEAVARFLSDKENVNNTKEYARKRATRIAAFDTLSFGLGSKIIAPARLGSAGRRAIFNSLVVQPPLQASLGGAGEYFAQRSTLEEGEEIRVGEVFMEAIGELAFAPVETILAQAGTRFADYKNIQQQAINDQRTRFTNFVNDYNNLSEQEQKIIDAKTQETFNRLKNNNPEKSDEEILDLTLKEIGTTDEILEAQRIIKENGYEDIAYNELNTRNEFEVRTNTDGTFDIVTLDRNDPSGFRTFASYDNNERAVKIQQELNNKVNTYVNQQTFLEDGVMQNLDITNPFVESFANEVLNTVIDGITFGNIEDAGVSLDTVNELKNIAQSKYFISPEVLKTNLPKKQFDAVMRIKADTLNAKPKKSISSKAFDTLLNDKNIDSNVNTDSFKRLGLQFVGEQNVDKMSIAQKRVLFTLLENLPASPESIALPDFTPRSFDTNDYAKAKAEIEKQGKATLKIIQDATGLNKVSAKRIMEYFVTAGYVNKKGNKFEFVGTDNQIYNADGTRKLSTDIEVNKKLEDFKQSIIKNNTINKNVREKFSTFLDELKDPTILEAAGSYNPTFNKILYTITEADVKLLQENPKEFLNNYARTQGHENFHALIQAGAFTQQEIQALRNTANNKKISPKLSKALQKELNTEEKYSDKTYLQFATEQYTGRQGYESPVDILEEGMALIFEDYILHNPKITGRPRTALEKISNFAKAFGNALLDNGFFTVEDIVEKTLQGKIAERTTGKTRGLLETEQAIDIPTIDETIVADEPSVKYKINSEQVAKSPDGIRIKKDAEKVTASRTETNKFDWTPQITSELQSFLSRFTASNLSSELNDLSQVYLDIIDLVKNPNEAKQITNLPSNRINKLLTNLQFTSQQMFVETINSYNDNTITNNNKNLFQLQRFNKESNQIDPSFYEGYIVGERPNAINNRKYSNPIIYSVERLAQIAAQSIKRPYQVKQGNRQKITKVRFRADDIVFNPMLLGNNVTISYQPDLRTGYIEPLQRALNKTYGNKPYLLVNDDVFLDSRKISETFIDVAPVTNKYKLRETNARLTKETKENLETQSGAPTLEGYFRQLYGSTNRIPINIKRFLTVGRGNGSEYIAPLMDFGSEAFIQSDIFKSDLSMFEKMKENLLYGPFEYPKDLTVEEAQQIYDAINIVTEQSIALFPDEILVYRGSDISEKFNLIPVTVSKSIAEAFGKNRTRREDRIERQYYNRKLEEEGISLPQFKAQVESLDASPRDIAKYGFNVKKFLLPKEAIAANMEALYRGSSMFPYNPVFNVFSNAYNFKGEAELLIPKQFLIDPETLTNLGKEVITTHLSKVADTLQRRIKLSQEFEENTEISSEPTLTQKELIEARQDLFKLATQSKFQRENISIDDIYELVLHPAMLSTQTEALSIPDVYENLTASQLEKRIDDMADDAVKTATDYAGGNLKYEKKAVIIIGPPGAGKSTFAEDIAARKGYAIVDADDIKKQMPEFKNGIGANATHKFSKILAASLNRQFISEGANLIIPKVTGRAKQKTGLYTTKIFIKDLIKSGYKVDIVYPDADINQAIVRNVTRFAETGRFVNLDYLLSIDNSVRDTYNLLKEIAKEEPTFKNIGFAYINNNYKIGEEIVEEDTTELFQDDRIVDENRIRSRGGREKTLREEEITEQDNALLRIAEEQKQNSIAAGVTPVINTNASPNAVATAVKTQQEIKNSPAENNADVNAILADIPNETKIKYSFNKSNKPLNKNAEELIENLTVRDDTIENKTTGQLVLEGFKSVDPLAFREGFLDQYARLAETDYKAGRKNKYGDKMLLASMSAGAALYFSDRSGDIFQQAFLRGVPVYDKDKGYTYVTNISPIDNKPITPFFDVFKPAYENPNLLWAFQSVMRVKRETRFNREGRKVKVTAADRKKAKQVLQDYPELQTMIDEYNRTNEHTVQFLVDTGVLDEQTGKTWLENADYIPFYRPLEGVEGFKGPQIFQGLSVTPFQRAKGSEEKDIVDPITGITNNLRAAINLGMKNIAANRVMRNFVDMGIAQKVKGNVKGPDIVTIRVKGKNVNFKVDDPMLYQSFSVMNQGDFAPQGLFMSILRGTKGFVSDLITRVPDFWFRQIVRDSASAYVLSGANYVPIISSIKESMSIAKGMITGRLPEEFVKLRNAGIITGYDKGVRDIDSTESLINNLYKNAFKSERPLVEKVYMFPIDLLSTVWDILGQGTAITDAATRVAVYKDTLKRTNNEAEAIFQALEVLNFTRRGNNQLFQLYAQSTMFLNPRLQGLDVFYRGLTGRYGIGKGLSRSKRLKAVLMRVSAVASLSVFYYLLAKDSEEYEEAPEEIKDNYLIIPGSKKLVGQPIAIPKPFEVGLITMTIPERLTSYFMDDIAGKDVADSLKRNLSHTLSITPPTAVDPLLENFFNYDFFTGRQIVPDYLKGTGDLAYRPQTDTLSKVIGDELNISPLYVENLFRSYSGTLGSWVMMATDSLIREGLTDAERVKFGIDRLPVVGTFLLPAEGSNFENQFYSMKKDVDDLVKTFRQIEQQAVDKGDLYVLGMLDEYQIGYMEALKNLQSELTDTADQLKEIRNFEAQIVNSTTLSAEEKKAQLDNIRATKNDLLKGIPEQRKFYLEEFRERAVVR